MLCRIVTKRRCPRLRNAFSKQLSGGTLVKSGSDAKFHPLPTFSDVEGSVVGGVQAAGAGHYIHLTGQYYDHDPDLTRNLVMKVGGTLECKEFEPQVIIDAALSDSEIKILTNILVDSMECRHVSCGEIDSIGSEDWNYGYLLGPNFTLFSRHDIILQQNTQNRGLVQLNSRPGFPLGQKIWLKDIENVFVNLSPRPWTTQSLGVRTLSDQITLLQHDRECDVRASETDDLEPSHDELGEIMLNTDWIVKVAAQLVYVTEQNRYKNALIPLYVPRVVQADLNPWVAMRNSLWQSNISDKVQKSQKDYIP